jgi:hypothetical protein
LYIAEDLMTSSMVRATGIAVSLLFMPWFFN